MPHKPLPNGKRGPSYGGYLKGNPSKKTPEQLNEEIRQRILRAKLPNIPVPSKKLPASAKAPKIQMTTLPAGKHPADSKLIKFFKRNRNTIFKVKSDFLRAFETETKIPVSTSELRLRELLRSGIIPQFSEHRVGRELGFNKKETIQTHVSTVSQTAATRAEAMKSPLFIEARKFGNNSLIEAYKAEIAKQVPSKERIKEIETVFSALNQKYTLEWLRAKASAK